MKPDLWRLFCFLCCLLREMLIIPINITNSAAMHSLKTNYVFELHVICFD